MGVSRLEEYDSDEDFEKRDEDVKWIGKGVSEHGRVYYPGAVYACIESFTDLVSFIDIRYMVIMVIVIRCHC